MEDAPERQNESAIRQPIEAKLTQPGSLAVLAADLRRIRASETPYRQGLTSNLIEQSKIEPETEWERVNKRDFMARSMKLLQEAGR